MNIKILSIRKRFSLLGLYPFKVILVDLNEQKYYSDYMDKYGQCKNFKPAYTIKMNKKGKK